MPVHLAHIVIFWPYLPGASQEVQVWRNGIIAAHAVMMIVSACFAALCAHLGRSGRSGRLHAWTPRAAAAAYLLFGAALAVIDQRVTTSITPLMLATFGVASTILLPPLVAGASYALSLALFWILLRLTQLDAAVVLSLRVNALSLAGLGCALSYFCWRSKVLILWQQHEIKQGRRELEKKNRELAFVASRDSLTGLANRSSFMSAARSEVDRLRRTGEVASIVLVDIDHFKAINDANGHPAGDAVLCEVARVLAAEIGERDVVARLGGEEFAILMPCATPERASEVAERMRARLEAHAFEADAGPVRLSASFGVAALTGEGTDPLSASYRAADRLLYRAKAKGRNRVCSGEMSSMAVVLEGPALAALPRAGPPGTTAGIAGESGAGADPISAPPGGGAHDRRMP